jgi:hypothetical protein
MAAPRLRTKHDTAALLRTMEDGGMLSISDGRRALYLPLW